MGQSCEREVMEMADKALPLKICPPAQHILNYGMVLADVDKGWYS